MAAIFIDAMVSDYTVENPSDSSQRRRECEVCAAMETEGEGKN